MTRATQPGSARLRLRWADAEGAHSVDVDRRLVLGSSRNVDVTVGDPSASRVHAELEPIHDGVVIRDLGSRNGTFVDRVQIDSARLAPGHLIRIGTSVFTVEAAHELAPFELWAEDRFGSLVGRSAAMRELFATLSRVAASDTSVLVRGETGSGKELVARSIHEASPRARQRYVVVDCAALPEHLLESELFGHARGAFTGATRAREGAIESARGGTIFLDEIGELPLSMQPKLLRVLENRTVRRIGESEHRPADVRFITATHRDLVASVARGEFREDLYFRLAVIPIRVPSLRERPEDIEMLVREFAGSDAERLLTPALLEVLTSRPWKGNVRELRNFVDRARALGVDEALGRRRDSGEWPLGDSATAEIPAATVPPAADHVSAGDGPAHFTAPAELFELTYKEFRERFANLGEREYLKRRLERCEGNVSRAARDVELARTYMHKLIKKNGL